MLASTTPARTVQQTLNGHAVHFEQVHAVHFEEFETGRLAGTHHILRNHPWTYAYMQVRS